tara:strand:+ start:1485 stop:1616 length:132 start_codon:yes stop_codon:yes gene_type:complete
MAKNNIRKTGGESWETDKPRSDGNNIRPFKRANLKKTFKEGYG